MQPLETFELLSYLVTIVGFPLERRRRADFRRLLPLLMKGKDPEFVEYFRALSAQEMSSAAGVEGRRGSIEEDYESVSGRRIPALQHDASV